ncbi:MAG: hypothetical protein HOI65_16090 [Opitutae bacterium]|nr:hypothetical protein [Opitutae bacterium]MBT5692633.1 hypothetical protein [Opitutae bacterium]
MSILLLIGSAFATMTLIEAQKTILKRNLAEARSNARFAIQTSLHQLQEISGPDQRISAPSSITKDSAGQLKPEAEQHWTGIWHSQKRTWNPISRKWIHEGRERDPFNGEWRQDAKPPDGLQKQAWLVSGSERKINGKWISPQNAKDHPDLISIYKAPEPQKPVPPPTTPGITPQTASNDVNVPAIRIPKQRRDSKVLTGRENRYAYWVADESTKLKVNYHENPTEQYPGAASPEIRDRLPLLSPRSNHLINNDTANKLLTPETLRAAGVDIDEDLALTHHFTSYSKGVLSNTARGGLKKDLSRGLGDQFPEKMAGEVMWQEALPQRGTDGKIMDLETFRKREDLPIDKDNAEAHRQFLRGPIWDLAHSWYSLYLPKPPFMPGFDGGIRSRLDPKYADEPWLAKPDDPVGNGQDPGLYHYHPNTMNHGPDSSLQLDSGNSPWIESRSGAGSSHNNWLFMTDHRSRFTYTNIPRWVHKDRIDVNSAMFPKGPFYRREKTRHPIAPVFLESTVKIGFFAVDGTYLWDLQARGSRGDFWRYKCERDNLPFDRTPQDWKKVNPVDPMPGCPTCGLTDSVRFLNGFNKFGKPNDRRYPIYHLDATKSRRQILEHLITDPGFRAVLSNEGHGGITNAWRLMKHNGGPLDVEKHSMGLGNGTPIERAAYSAMRDVFKLQMIIRPYVVYWNPYNVTLKNARPGIGFHMGNSRGRFDSGDLHLPDAKIITSNGPLTFEFPQNRNKWIKTDYLTFTGAFNTRYVDTITNDFRRWYDETVPAPNPNDFRPHSNEAANRAFFHDWNRVYFFCREPYDFAPGELQIFTPILNQRTRDGNATLVPGMEEGIKYTQPLTTRLIKRGENIKNITYFSHQSLDYELHARHRNSWRMVTFLDKTNKDTSKKKGKGRIHLSILERLAPKPTSSSGLEIPVGRSIESLVPRDYEQFSWWNTVMAGVTDKQTGNMREEAPKNPIAWRRAGRYRGPFSNGRLKPDGRINHGVPNEYLADIIDTITIQDDQYFFGCLSVQRAATDTVESDGLPYWSQFNPRALSVLRNSETESTPFGWDVSILSLNEAESTGRINSAMTGYPKWGPSYGVKGKDKLAMIDVPRQPMHSLVEFTNADLGNHQMMPTFATGNSYASPVIQPNLSYTSMGPLNLIPSATEKLRNSKHKTSRYMNPFNFCIPDISYHLNKALFDRYFFSTIPDIPNEPSNMSLHRFKNKNYQLDPKTIPPFKAFDPGFVLNYFGFTKDESGNLVKSGGDPRKFMLPNPRMEYHVPPELALNHDRFKKEYFDKLHDYDTAAAHLMIDGPFNVNSTSVEAWKGLLQILSKKLGTSLNPLLRSVYPQGAANDTWNGFPTLNDGEVEELAEAIVGEVKSRGPFHSLADFINRRLTNPKALQPGELKEHAYSGAVQTAIDKTINKKGVSSGGKMGSLAGYKPKAGSTWIQGLTFFEEHFAGKTHGNSVQASGTPGWIMQSDVLRPIAPILKARSDTFTIRGYGDVQNNSGIKAKAICEAIVQRMPDYIHPEANQSTDTMYGNHLTDRLWYEPDPSLIPSDPGNLDRDYTIKLDGDPAVKGTGKSAVRHRLRRENFRLGRRYKIVSFRWL